MSSLKEIAAAAGVSIRTVSRVLKNSGYASPETRKVVMAAANRLGYRPNRFARSLKTQKGYEVTVLAWSFDELQMAKIAGLEQALRQADYSASILFGKPEIEHADELLQELLSRRPAAVVAFAASPKLDQFWAERLTEENVPYVLLDSKSEQVDSVRIDRQQGVYEAVLYLAAKGRQRIAYFGPQDVTRLDGYYRALEQLGREPICLFCEDHGNESLIRLRAREILESQDGIDAIQMHSDETAMSFLMGVHDMGVSVPQDLAVVGFDDRNAARLCWPPLTTVAQPNRQVGAAAADVVMKKIAEQDAPLQGWSCSLPTRLVVRQSA